MKEQVVSNVNSRAIIVLGMHRSGTSLVARGLKVLGVELGDSLLRPSEDNPKGFWEDRDIVHINERLLTLQHRTWDTLAWDEVSNFRGEEYEKVREEAKLVIQHRFMPFRLWGFKDPRTARLLKFWLPLFEELAIPVSFVIAIREPAAVALSLARRNGLPGEISNILWVEYTREMVGGVQNSNVVIVDYNLLVDSPMQQLQRVADGLGIGGDVDPEAIKAFAEDFVERGLDHAVTVTTVEGGIASIAQICYELLNRVACDELTLNSRAFQQQWHQIIKQLSSQRRSIEYIDQLEQEARRVREKVLINLRGELEKRGNAIVRLEKEVDARGSYIKQLEDTVPALKSVIEEKNIHVASLTTVLQQTYHKNDELISEKNALISEKNALMSEKDALAQELNAIKNSTTWRVAFPFRWLFGILPSLIMRLTQRPINAFKIVLQPIIAELRLRVFSKNNLHCLNLMSKKRGNYACSEQQARLLLHKIKNWPQLTISVVTYNGYKWLNSFIKSVREQSYPVEKIEIIFVDHGSTDETWERIKQLQSEIESVFAGFQCYQRPNRGFGSGHDFAIRKAVTDRVLVTNIDLEFLPNTLTELVAHAESDSAEVATWEACQLPYEHPKYYDPITLETSWSSHACILIDRKKYLEVGGYERRIFMYGEDVELSYRFRSHGYNLRYIPDAKVLHFTYQSAGQIKPLQFSGSTLANIYIRLRYGSLRDVLAGYFLQLGLLLHGGGFSGSRKIVAKNILKSVLYAPAFIFYSKKTQACFSFYGFDYEMVRDGAFYNLDALENEDLPLVSVITRTVDGRGFLLRECIASVLNQTYPNIEHLIVEDGGDSGVKIVQSVSRRFGCKEGYSIKHLAAPKRGRSYAGNLGLANARGAYIVFLDDDDLVFPDHVEVLYKAVTYKGADAAYGLAWEVLSNVDKSAEHYEEKLYQTLSLFRQEFDRDVLFEHNYLPLQSVLFSRNIYEKCGGFEEDMDYLEDWNLWCRYVMDHNFTFVPKTTSLYRTPCLAAERLRRAELLNRAYRDAKSRLVKIIEKSALQRRHV